jgi:4-nitrophenyl phosphatase
VPGAGSIQALLSAATDVTPLVIGKPEPTMLHAAIEILHADAQYTLVIGDRLDTDIAGAVAAGLASALVLTGVTTTAELEHSALQPDVVYAGLPELVAEWNNK